MTQLFKRSHTTVVLSIAIFGALALFVTMSAVTVQAAGDSGCSSDCGGGTTGGGTTGGGGGSTAAPTCDIRTNLTMVNPGAQYTISWTGVSGATYQLGGRSVSSTGSYTMVWDANNVFITYTLTGSMNGKTCSDTVTVYRYVTAPVCNISTSLSVVEAGQQFTISWNGTPTHSTSYKINGAVVNPTGSATYTFPADKTSTTFTMTASNAAGTCSKAVTITKKVVTVPTPVCTLTAAPTSITAGNSSVIKWTTTNAVSGTIDQGIGAITLSSTAGRSVTPTATKTYTMTVTNSAGATATCAATVTVRTVVPAPVCTLTATPTSITAGNSSVIKWTSTNAVSGTINQGIGAITLSSTAGRSVTPASTKTYTMTVTNSAGATATCAATVTVRTVVPAPTCTLTATPSSIVSGNASQLKWTSTNAVSGTIDQGVGTINPTNTAGVRSVSPTATKTYTLTVLNSAGVSATCAATVTVRTVVPTPVCTLTATPASITAGNSSVIKWTTNAVSGTIDQGIGAIVLTNTAGRSVTPTASKTYTLTVLNSAGASATCIATVSVRTVTPAPTCTLTATPSSITTGNSSTIKWTITNAVSGTIDQGIGAIVLTNTAGRSVTPAATKTYTMTVTNSAGATATCAAAVSVTTPTPDAPVCDYFRANPVTINRGESSTLTWATTRATSVSINNGVGSVAVDGSYTVSPLESTTYTLIANGAGGTTNCAVPVTVVQPHNNLTCSQNVRFYADDNSITEGDQTTLHWDTTDVTSVSITDLGSVSVDGSQSVSPSSDRTYNLTASNGSDTVTCPVTIDVEEEQHSGGGSSNSPRCELTISDGTITLGERVTVKWTSSYASDIILKDSDGKTLVTTEDRLSSDKRELYDGDITLRPEKNTTYTLIAKTSSRTKECTVNVVVSGAVVVSQIRDQQPLVSGIALAQVPYTGFEAGPIMTFFFFGLLALWALYLAYVLVARRSGEMVAVAAAGTVVSDTTTPGHALFSTITPTPVFHQPTVAPVVEAAATAVVGYGTAVVSDEVTLAIENHAHAAHVLLSGDALRSFVDATASATDRMATLDVVLNAAKGAYPAEDGWVVLGEERMNALLAAN